MTATHDDYLRTPYFGSLDGLRAIAVLGVIWQHVAGRHVIWEDIAGAHGDALGRLGLGVSLFFAISGFLITTLLLREHSATGSVSLRRFYIRRTLRIFPLYFAVLGVYVVLVALTRQGTAEGAQFFDSLPAYATYTSNWFVLGSAAEDAIFYHAWSLATEEQFYLVWPALLLAVLAIVRRPGHALAVACAVVGAAVLADQFATHEIQRTHFLLTVVRSIATPICLGAILAAVLHHPTGYARAARVLRRRWAAPALALALIVALQALPTFWVELCMALLVAAVCVREDHALAPGLTMAPLRLIGVVSYGVYLMHMLAANAVRPLLGHDFGIDVFAATAVVATALAYVSYRWFETPILRLKTRFGSEPPAAPAARRLTTAQPIGT